MLFLTISTSTEQGMVAIGSSERVLASASVGKAQAQGEFLTPAIEFCACQAQVDLTQIAGVAVDRGPGLFTGLRIGVATAKAIALTLSVPMVPLESLDLLAFAARVARRPIWSLLDARRGEVFAARYRPTPGGVERSSDYMLATPNALVGDLMTETEDVLLVGNGACQYYDVFSRLSGVTVGDVGLAHPTAESALGLACSRFTLEEFSPPSGVVPLYLRKSDAEIKWGTRRESIGV